MLDPSYRHVYLGLPLKKIQDRGYIIFGDFMVATPTNRIATDDGPSSGDVQGKMPACGHCQKNC
jgi:hypothetical protein